MLIDEIKKVAKIQKVVVSVDLNGVLSEVSQRPKEQLNEEYNGFFKTARPLKSNIKTIKKLSKLKNVAVRVLTSVYNERQKEDKIIWLKNNLSFVPNENIDIIVYTVEQRNNHHGLKGQFLKDYYENKNVIVYHIDDDLRIIYNIPSLPFITPLHVSVLTK